MHGFLLRSKGFQNRDTTSGLQQAFHDCEAEFIQIAGREGLRDGTTAVVCLVQDESLTVAHVGDSRGVLCREGGKALAITQDHKPELEAEKRRIEALGGFVSYIGCWRKRNPPQPPPLLSGKLRLQYFTRQRKECCAHMRLHSLPSMLFLNHALPLRTLPLLYRLLNRCHGDSRHVACYRRPLSEAVRLRGA